MDFDLDKDAGIETAFGDVGADSNPWTEPEEAPQETKEPEEVKPQVVRARQSSADLISTIWGGIGTFALTNTGIDPPVGRMMSLQAPLAGAKIDSLIAGTWLDSLLQPLAQKGDALAEVGAILMGPILIGFVERNPESIPMVEPFLRQVIETSLVEMAPILKKKQADQRKAARAMADISEAFDIPKGEDPFNAIVGYIFQGGNQQQAQPETEPDER